MRQEARVNTPHVTAIACSVHLAGGEGGEAALRTHLTIGLNIYLWLSDKPARRTENKCSPTGEVLLSTAPPHGEEEVEVEAEAWQLKATTRRNLIRSVVVGERMSTDGNYLIYNKLVACKVSLSLSTHRFF